MRDANGWRIRFRRTFGLAETVEWDNLCRIFDLHPYTTGEDEVKWSLEASGEFSTRSIYGRLTHGEVVTHFKEVWKMRVPPKIKVFFCGNSLEVVYHPGSRCPSGMVQPMGYVPSVGSRRIATTSSSHVILRSWCRRELGSSCAATRIRQGLGISLISSGVS
jgi:hypothetical protein